MLFEVLLLLTLFRALVSCDLPSNYQCASGQSINQLGLVSFDYTQAISTISYTCTDSSHFVWYKWNATFTGYLQASTCGMANFNTVISVYTECEKFSCELFELR